MTEPAPRPRFVEALQRVMLELERAYGEGGARGDLLPALRPLLGGLLGGLLDGCLVVSRGPWVVQRELLLTLLDTPARRSFGPVDARIDDATNDPRTGCAPPSPDGPRVRNDVVTTQMSIHPRLLHASVRTRVWRCLATRVVGDIRPGKATLDRTHGHRRLQLQRAPRETAVIVVDRVIARRRRLWHRQLRLTVRARKGRRRSGRASWLRTPGASTRARTARPGEQAP